MFNEKTGKYEGYIYCIVNEVNFKTYIGQTTRCIEDRMKQHKSNSGNINRSIYLYSDVRDYGWDSFGVFEIEKIECDSLADLKKTLDEKEVFYISDYNSLYPNGYNISKGGWLLPNMFDTCRVYKFDLDGNLLCEYESMMDAAFNNSVSEGDISNCCNGKKIATVGGFYWSKTPEFPKHLVNRRQKTRVAAYDLDGNFIKKFDSIKEAVEEMVNGNKYASSNIGLCCRGKYKQAYGYIWKYC